MYYKVTVSLKGVSKKVYREFYVLPTVSVYELGIAIVSSFNGVFEHMFFFESMEENMIFEDELWLDEECDFTNRFACDYKDVTINYLAKIGNKIDFIYDTGENYGFKVVIDKERYNFIDDRRIIINKAKGYGIFEDAHSLLDTFLESDKTFYKVCLEYANGDDWLPLGLEFPLDGTKDDYYKSIKGEELEDLMDKVEEDTFTLFQNEQNY